MSVALAVMSILYGAAFLKFIFEGPTPEKVKPAESAHLWAFGLAIFLAMSVVSGLAAWRLW